MMKVQALPGLEHLVATCRRYGFTVSTMPPSQSPPSTGTWVEGHPLDPQLAAFYARMGQALFATNVTGMGLFRWDGSVNELERENRVFRENSQHLFALPLVLFGGETGLAHAYATVPSLADESGLQPVIRVNLYDQPYALPVASSVDRFIDGYARFLEALVVAPGYAVEGSSALIFPWDVAHLLARDHRLVELLRSGRFEPLLPHDEDSRAWIAELRQHGGAFS